MQLLCDCFDLLSANCSSRSNSDLQPRIRHPCFRERSTVIADTHSAPALESTFLLPFYSPGEYLGDVANQWNDEHNVSLTHYEHESTFLQQVRRLCPPVVALGAESRLLTRQIIARVAALKVRPVIVALVKSTDESLVTACYQQGADRVIAVPQCSARIFRALISTLHSHDIYYPPYRFDAATQSCSINNRTVRLTSKRFDIAHYLFTNQGNLIPKPVILKDIWGLEGKECVTRRLEVHITHVRRQLILDGSLGWEVRSRRKMGYGIFNTSRSSSQKIQSPVRDAVLDH